jgi:DNA-binding MarR family transcriptional regulator
MNSSDNQVLLKQAVDLFWESYPPFWHRVRAHIRQVADEQFGITVEQFQILRHMRMGQASVSDLAHAKNISRPAISQSVDILVNKGYILRTTDKNDRRHIQLDLTDAGNALMDAITNNTRQWMMGILSQLTRDELISLTGSMASLKKIN